MLEEPVASLPLIGPTNAKKLKRLGIATKADLLYHLPSRYEDLSLKSEIAQVQPGETVTVTATLQTIKNVFAKSGRQIQSAQVSDTTGSLAAIWFNQPFLTKILSTGSQLNLSGKIDLWAGKLAMISPDYEKVIPGRIPIHTARLVPVYPETSGVSSKWLRSRVAYLLADSREKIDDHLSPEILKKEGFLPLRLALEKVHFPSSPEQAEAARTRIAFDELLSLQLASLARKRQWESLKLSHRLALFKPEVERFIKNLPFALTTDQKHSLNEIMADLSTPQPMNRLLEGDVGSGKTVIALIACYIAALNKKKAILMAPTQILAVQHYQTFTSLLKYHKIPVSLLTSSSKLRAANDRIIIGTHSLLFDEKLKKDPELAIIVIDEQHRFGVSQRSHFLADPTRTPHVLTMTATPIPRTVALTLYGDLDFSQINTSPPGRQQVTTWTVPLEKRDAAYRWIENTLKKTSSQGFIICPFIEPSETQLTIKSAKLEYERLKTDIFPKLRLALLHGKMPAGEKESVMEKFKNGDTDILVATPLVEVGIDIPNACIIVIEDADRFGLSQLHQLRGRVGRGEVKSYCLTFTNSSPTPKRLLAFEQTFSGIKLAELDLKLRGPGNPFSTLQHGFPKLKAASFQDVDLIKKAKFYATQIGQHSNPPRSLRDRLLKAKMPHSSPN